MLFRLAIQFFLQHAKRSIRGSKIIAISLIAVFITQILILAFSTQLTGLTALVQSNDDYLIVEPTSNHVFDTSVENQILSFANDSSRISEAFRELRVLGSITFDQQLDHIPLHFIDLSTILTGYDNLTSIILPTTDWKNILSTNDDLTVKYQDKQAVLAIPEFLTPDMPSIDSGLYLDFSVFNQTTASHIYLQLTDSKYRDNIIGQLHERFNVKIEVSTDETTFIRDSQHNIEDILFILTLMIAVLIIMGIYNLVNAIIFESRYEIRTLKTIGYSVFEIRLIFIYLVAFLGLAGSILAILVGIAIPNIVFSSLALFRENIYIPIDVTFQIFGQTFIVGTIIPIISAIRPIRRGVQ